jgi:hypothetical protein
MQRAVQWGNDTFANVFGVTCSKPARYSYFSCTIRNRLEKWDSPAWLSPTQGLTEGGKWQNVGGSHVRRPTKLIDGSRGGQAFICDLFIPEEDHSYSIETQACMQFRSILLVAVGLMNLDSDGLKNLDRVMQEDFQLDDNLGVIFRPLFTVLVVVNILVIALSVAAIYSIFTDNIFGTLMPFVIQVASLLLWAVGAVGLLMLGGNPRVKVIKKKKEDLPEHIRNKLEALSLSLNYKGDVVEIRFGSLHGSRYTPDHGYCAVPFFLVEKISRCDLVSVRPRSWVIGLAWWSICLLLSIAMQIMGAQVATVGSQVFSVIILLMTALARGYGVAGPEEWLIPRWKRRKGAAYGAPLVGKMEARAY